MLAPPTDVDAEKGSWRWGVVFGESPADLLPRLRQFAVVVDWRGGERAFAGEGTGGYGAGGERIAMEDWRMFARRRPKTSNSAIAMPFSHGDWKVSR